jgi:hypothetical protein
VHHKDRFFRRQEELVLGGPVSDKFKSCLCPVFSVLRESCAVARSSAYATAFVPSGQTESSSGSSRRFHKVGPSTLGAALSDIFCCCHLSLRK